MPCSFCRGDCRDGGGRFASTASILCRKTPGGGTVARFSMQFARAARPGGPGCRPCGCGWQPARASRPWRSGFLPPLQLRAAAGACRGFPRRSLRVPFLALSLSAWFGPPLQRESMGGASRARKSAVSGQQTEFWHKTGSPCGVPKRFRREPDQPTWAFLKREPLPASRRGGSRARARFRGQKSGIIPHGRRATCAAGGSEKGTRTGAMKAR